MPIKYDDETYDVLKWDEAQALSTGDLLEALWDFGCSVCRSRNDDHLMVGHIDEPEYKFVEENNEPAPTR
jgi:hypothetical protein